MLAEAPQPQARIGRLDCAFEVPPGTSLRLDSLGRWYSARLQGAFYRRTANSRAVRCTRAMQPPVDVTDCSSLHDRIAQLAAELRERFRNDETAIKLSGELADRRVLLARLELAAAWTAERFAAEAGLFRKAYPEPVEILPPDRYLDVVAVPATGCPHGKCCFCAFYQDHPFQPRSADDFERHLDAVRRLFGPALALKNGVFLGSASALSLAQETLLKVLERARETLGVFRRGVAAFWDPDHSPLRTAADWRELRDNGLVAVYAGLETGLAPLRQELGKSAGIDRFVQAVRGQNQSGIRTGITVLAGVGGRRQAAAHRRETAAAIRAMGLGKEDKVFVSPVVESLPEAELEAEAARLFAEIAELTPAQVAPYRMDMFRYYA